MREALKHSKDRSQISKRADALRARPMVPDAQDRAKGFILGRRSLCWVTGPIRRRQKFSDVMSHPSAERVYAWVQSKIFNDLAPKSQDLLPRLGGDRCSDRG